jgi:hypothetical protein
VCLLIRLRYICVIIWWLVLNTFAWWLIWYIACCVVDSDNATYIVVALSSCRPVSSEARQTARFLWRVVAMSPCRVAYKPILRFEPSDKVTSRQYAARQRAVWRKSLATGRQDESPTMRRLALCPVVASANTTHKSVKSIVADLVYCALRILYRYRLFVLSLATTRHGAKRSVVALSSCRPVSCEARQTAHFRDVALSLGL